jgi:hypothetical protein
MTPTDYYWKRSQTPGAERWLLHERWPTDPDLERIVGVVVKAKNKIRCRMWNVRSWDNTQWVWETVAVLRDMKTGEAMDTAKLILLSLKEST